MSKKKRSVFIKWKEDPNEGKEDTRPVELRKKPTISIGWKKIKGILNIE